MKLTKNDIDLLEEWWVRKSRVNFLAYRRFMRLDYIGGWFPSQLALILQNFYVDLKAGRRPILLISTPPQHGKSVAIIDFISWMAGKAPKAQQIFASYSENLGVRCNNQIQRYFDSKKYQKIFPNTRINKSNVVSDAARPKRNSYQIEFVDKNKKITGGRFLNTTVGGPITGETMDVGYLDDAVKGRKEASSPTISRTNWEWFTDDFGSRLSEYGGFVGIMTRWTNHDIFAKIIEIKDNFPGKFDYFNFQAIATKDEKYRKEGEALFPELKSLDFLKAKKATYGTSGSPRWEAMYQGNPTVTGGNLFKNDWWRWWKVLPPLKYKFIVADTAQKDKKQNDFTVFQCWGYGVDKNIYLLDKRREKMKAPALRKEAEIFYRNHDTKRENVGDPILRGMYIEDKSSGVGLIQELRSKRLKIYEVPRSVDKVFRAEDASPYIESGRVYLNTEIAGIGNLTKEANEFPNGEFDDDIDTLMSAVEVAFINKKLSSGLIAAMSAGD